MKKIMSIILCLLLGGCCSNKVDPKKYELLLEKNLQLENEIKELTLQQNMSQNFMISGGFVATVRDLLPDYMVDDFTLRAVALQQFQGKMSFVYVDEKIAKELKINQTYYFEIEPFVIENTNFTKQQVIEIVGEDFGAFNWIKITAYRTPKENEVGLESCFIQVEEISN